MRRILFATVLLILATTSVPGFAEAESWLKMTPRPFALRKPSNSSATGLSNRPFADIMRNPKAGIFRDRGAFEALTAGDCGAHYRKVETGESDFLDRTLKLCTDLAPTRGALMVMTPAGFVPVTDGYLCVHEGPFPAKVECPAEAPLFVGVSDVWYGCIRPASTPSPQIERGHASCIDGFSVKYFGESWGYLCVDDQDEYGDLVDRSETVCGKPSAEIAFAGFAENPNMMVHCCGERRSPE